MEPADPCLRSDRSFERRPRRERTRTSQAPSHKLAWTRNASNSPTLGVVDREHPIRPIFSAYTRQLAPTQASRQPEVDHVTVWVGQAQEFLDFRIRQPIRWPLLNPRHHATGKRRSIDVSLVFCPPEARSQVSVETQQRCSFANSQQAFQLYTSSPRSS
jgi:hypothetical protein